MDYQIVFRDQGDDFYFDREGHLNFKREGGDEIIMVYAKNVDAFIQFLRDEKARLAAREVAK